MAPALSWNDFIDAVASPMVVFDRYLDVVASNTLAQAVSAAFRVGSNLGRFTFLNPMVEETAAEWSSEARRVAAALRDSLRRHEADARFRELVGELMAQSEPFAQLWAAPAATPDTRGAVVFKNPLVGEIHLAYEHLHRPGSDGPTIMLWAPVDAASSERLQQLASILDANPPTPH
ncbi:hypothetical protein GCM10027413_05790 [Conyzicola nivalis]|uniref:MmyB-like transcription regulator ligand binding domain-containing protein n=1 Tax=Conyzicola nivalis TaxID=1477021 RepID=A0A916SLJ2_9MICO|nr:hypothetical protein [Conyzicola nivalis]GGB05981.1 hypothetical protein GCM10010979_20840 [Conyzicola nivalis]